MPKNRFQNYYYFSSLFFAMAFIVVLTIKMIFAWNPPTAGAPGPSGQTLYSDTNHNIGIGTLYPNSKLEIFSTSSDSILELSRGPETTTSTIFKIGTDSAFIIQNQSTDMFAIKNGNVGINTTNPNEKLTVEGVLSIKESDIAPSTTSGYGKLYTKPLDNYTKLLLHMDGDNNSTMFIDSSLTPKTVTVYGNTVIDRARSKLGVASAYFDGTEDYLSIPDSEDWNFGSGDFTIDGWINLNNTSGAQDIVAQYTDANNRMQFYNTSGTLNMNFLVGGVYIANYYTTDPVLSAGTWHHIAFIRNGSNAYIFLDGVSQLLSSLATFGTKDMGNYSGDLTIGNINLASYLNGYLDELRVSKGVARWTANFTPPTSQYSASGLFFKSSSGEEIQL